MSVRIIMRDVHAAKQTYALLDHWMWGRQVRFAKRRHPNKSWQWKREKYWGKILTRNDQWIFMDKQAGNHLLKLAWTPIRRHALVIGKASPDNPELRDYWKERQTRKVRTLSSSKLRIALWKRQQGKCLLCKEALDNGESIHCHHRLLKSQGGDNRIDNLCLLHKTCHLQVHSKLKSSAVSNLLEPYEAQVSRTVLRGGRRLSALTYPTKKFNADDSKRISA